MTTVESNNAAEIKILQLIPLLSLMASFTILGAIYHFFGNTAFLETTSKSTFAWLLLAWTAVSPGMTDTSHGPLVVVFSLITLWQKRKDITESSKYIWAPASVIMICGLLLHWCGLRAQQTMLSLIALIMLIWSIPAFIYGRDIGRILIFPCTFLIFAIPWNFLDSFSFQLRLLASSVSDVLLNGIGIQTERIGTAIFVAGTNGLALDVADPCSGIRSLTALCALTTGYATFLPLKPSGKALLIISSIPIAVLANVARIATIAIAAKLRNPDFALRIYHDFSGFLVFIAAVLMIMAIGSLLRKWLPSNVRNTETQRI